METYIIQIGNVERKILERIKTGIDDAFPTCNCRILEDALQPPKEAYNPTRQQYKSELILREVLNHTLKIEGKTGRKCILLGIADVDIYTLGMNFIFGEAQCPGRAAIVSLYRLRPEFYGERSNEQLFMERAIKEAVHEIGHTFGLGHCLNPICVMHFSLYIGMTDRKKPKLCSNCLTKLNIKTKEIDAMAKATH